MYEGPPAPTMDAIPAQRVHCSIHNVYPFCLLRSPGSRTQPLGQRLGDGAKLHRFGGPKLVPIGVINCVDIPPGLSCFHALRAEGVI